jgi:hypothetical protein
VVFFVCVHLIGVRVHLVDVGDIVDHNWFDLETKTCTKIINWKISIFFRKFYPTNQLLYQLHTSLSYRPPWSISYGSWISNYLCNQCLSLLKLQVRIPLMARCTRYNIIWKGLPLTCGRSVVISGYSSFLHQYNWPPRYS